MSKPDRERRKDWDTRRRVSPARWTLRELYAIGYARHADELPQDFIRRAVAREVIARGVTWPPGRGGRHQGIRWWARAGARDAFRGFPGRLRPLQSEALRRQEHAAGESIAVAAELLDHALELLPAPSCADDLIGVSWTPADGSGLRWFCSLLDCLSREVPPPAADGKEQIARGRWSPSPPCAEQAWAFPGAGVATAYTGRSSLIPPVAVLPLGGRVRKFKRLVRTSLSPEVRAARRPSSFAALAYPPGKAADPHTLIHTWGLRHGDDGPWWVHIESATP